MSTAKYTPTMDEARDHYVAGRWESFPNVSGDNADARFAPEFDRMLAAHDAALLSRGVQLAAEQWTDPEPRMRFRYRHSYQPRVCEPDPDCRHDPRTREQHDAEKRTT